LAFTGRARKQPHCHQHGRQGPLAHHVFVERLASVAPTTVSARPALRLVVTSTSTMAGAYIRVLTATIDQAYFTPRSPPLGSLTPAWGPLIGGENLSRQPGPPHASIRIPSCLGY
jgi:hypothetical protein